MLTPVHVYLKVRDAFSNPILLESYDQHLPSRQWSYICCDPLATITIGQGQCRIDQDVFTLNGTFKAHDYIRQFMERYDPAELNFPFTCQGLFGYTAYNGLRHQQHIAFTKTPGISIPDVYYALYRKVLVFDHYHNTLHVFCHDTSDTGLDEALSQLVTLIECKQAPAFPFQREGKETTGTSEADYLRMVNEAKEHCQRGNVFQLVLSRAFRQPFRGDDFQVYRHLRQINPSPYLFYFDYGSFRLFGSSPESQLIIRQGEAILHPIAGTVKRSGDEATDLLMTEKLMQDSKEQAEHVMLVDLARNDLSRHCHSVHLNYYKQPHYFSHVIHLVSEVCGTLKPGRFHYEVMMDSFPAGTLSGAPKHKAIELIHGTETEARHFYGGCIGMMDFKGHLQHAIMIRTMLSKDHVLHYQAGAGIVTGSIPKNELQEVTHKIGALRQAIHHADKYTNLETHKHRAHEKVAGI